MILAKFLNEISCRAPFTKQLDTINTTPNLIFIVYFRVTCFTDQREHFVGISCEMHFYCFYIPCWLGVLCCIIYFLWCCFLVRSFCYWSGRVLFYRFIAVMRMCFVWLNLGVRFLCDVRRFITKYLCRTNIRRLKITFSLRDVLKFFSRIYFRGYMLNIY